MMKTKTFSSMKKLLKKTLPSVLCAFIVVACTTKVDLNDTRKVSLVTMQEVTYDTTNTVLNLIGRNTLPDGTALTTINFYKNGTCSTAVIGTGSQTAFETTGIQVTVPSTGQTTIYAKTNTNANCISIITYDPTHAAPPAPSNITFSPASPSRTSTTPRIFGSVSGVTLNVEFYSNVGCTVALGNGLASNFTTVGIPLSVSSNTTTTVYAKAIEPFGNASPCTSVGTYIHSTTGPAAPTFTSISPISPTFTSTTPVVKGSLDANSVSITIFSESTCTTSIASGTKAEFLAGISVTVPENATTTMYGVAYDGSNNPSACTYLTTFINDTSTPVAPIYVTSAPLSPTGATLYPNIIGSLPIDAVAVRLYNSSLCTNQIGAGTSADFQNTGVSVSIVSNATISIYAKTVDAAGNTSACTYLTDYTSDTIPPDAPVFSESNPTSPTNQSITPLIVGGVSPDTDHVSIFSDLTCSTQIGTGTAAAFQSTGIQVSVSANTLTNLYAIAYDLVGNATDCTFLSTYDHSNLTPPAPVFTTSSPLSPTNQTVSGMAKPFVIGTLVPIITSVQFYSNNTCTTSIGAGSAANFKSSGVRINLPINAVSTVYTNAMDKYGNQSACSVLTTFTHTNITPQAPTFTAFSPVSPTRLTSTPNISGTANNVAGGILPTSTIKFYDSPFCVNNIGTETQANFNATGATISVGVNTTTNVHAKTFDAAGNFSACTYMGDYTHDTLLPGRPILDSATPGTPSYSQATIIKGHLGPNVDILPAVSVSLFTDAACAVPLASAAVGLFTTTGIPVTVGNNATTTIYGYTTNLVGTNSVCNLLINFLHTDTGPNGLTATPAANGSINVGWLPDVVASPAPTYTLRRATKSGGPYAVVANNIGSTSYIDKSTSNSTTYYYVVYAQNSTGHSLDSAETSAAVAVSAPNAPLGLTATPGPTNVLLNWSTDPADLTYDVYRSTSRGGPYTLIKTAVTSNQYMDSTVTNDTPYYYVITASNPAGTSAYSSEASAVPKNIPPSPTKLTGAWIASSPVCSGQPAIYLSWSAPSFYNRFNINVSIVGSGQESVVASVLGTVTNYTYCPSQTALYSPNFGHWFTITADWGGMNGLPSNEVEMYYVAPTLTASPGNNEVYLSWLSAGTLNHTAIKRATKPGGPYTTLTTVSGTGTYTDSTAVNGTGYFYIVEPQMNLGSEPGIYSNEAAAVPGTVPAAPTNLVLTVANNTPTLDWTAPSRYNGFNIYTAPAAGGPWTLSTTVTNPAVNTYTDPAPVIGRTYYRVTALWGASYETAATNTVSFRNGVPGSMTATVMSSTTIKTTWNTVAGATSYTLKRSTTQGGPYTTVSAAAVSPYTDTVTTDTGYYYVVQAFFGDGTSSQHSTEVRAQAGTGSIPSGVTVSNFSSSAVTLQWAPVSGAIGYKIYWGTTNGGPYPNNKLPGNVTSNVITGLNPNTNYYFRVTSLKPAESSQSAQVSALTVNTPTAPLVDAGNNAVTLNWGGAVGASTYLVQRSTDKVNFSTIISGLTTYTHYDTGLTNGQVYFYRIGGVYSIGTLYSPISSSITPGITPLVPNGLSAITNNNGTDVYLSWSGVSGATSYNVYTYNTGIYTFYGNSTSASNFNVTGLTANSPVTFAVTALNGSLETGYSSLYTVVPMATQAAPTALMIAANTAKVDWAAVPGAVSYNLDRSLDGINFTQRAGAVAAITFNDNTVVSNQAYYYRFTPVFAGSVLGSISNISLPVTPTNALLAPAALTATASGTGQIDLSWVQSPNAVSYRVYRGTATGGPYSLLSTVTAPTTTYSDSTVVGGNSYFYVVTTVNLSDVNSPYSNEAGVTLGSAPTGLGRVITNGKIQVSWNAVGGATGYTLKRALALAGPYATIYSGPLLTYGDTTVKNGVTYYYTVNATLASGDHTLDATPVNGVGIATMKLQVPIELTDQAMSSNTSAYTFERSQTYLDPSAYDGAVSYDLEVVAINTDSGAAMVDLVDSFGSVVGTVSVPAGTTAPKRVRAAMAALVSTDFYRVKLRGTTSAGDLQVMSVKLWITQNGASKTKIYIPLISSNASANGADYLSRIASTSGLTYITIPQATDYIRNTSVMANLDPSNPWEMEAVVAANPGETGVVALYDTSRAAAIPDSETYFDDTTPTLTNISLSDQITNFDSTSEGDHYQISIRCLNNCASGVHLYKAGLWVTLTDLSKAEVIIRNGLGNSNPPAGVTTHDDSRVLVDTGLYSNPTVYFQATATAPNMGTIDVSLMDDSNLDINATSLSLVPGSTLNFSSPTSSSLRSGAITPTSGNRFMPQINPSAMMGYFSNSAVVIDAVR